MSVEQVDVCSNLPDYSADIAIQKATEATNIANQELAKIPAETIANLNEAIKKLLKIVNGWEDTSNPDFDPDAVIDDIINLIDSVINPLIKIISSVNLPEIPGLADIQELVDALKATKKSEFQRPGKLPEIPQEQMDLLKDLLAAISALATTLPMVLVNIILNSIDLILKTKIPVVDLNFYSIIGMVPFIQEIPELVELAPQITTTVTDLPGKLNTAVQTKIKEQLKAVNDLQVPQPPPDIAVQTPVLCPIHS